jgi:NAD(P)-dependent dehydrogenase (short-subunit alcohol dehydrogenase family)
VTTMLDTICLITGASNGIGKATAARLAQMGATILAVSRDRTRGDAAAADIRRHAPQAQVEVLIADLSRLDDVRRLAAKVADCHERLDVLINNAGAVDFRRETTADGLDATFATNHLGPFLLTNLLRPQLAASGAGRVITVASSGHRQVKAIPWADLPRGSDMTALQAYQTSKLLNVLFTYELARRLAGTRVTANCADPGFVRTQLGRDATGPFRVFLRLTRPWQSSPATGAETSVYLASSTAAGKATGGYFSKSRQTKSSPLSQDREAAKRLWELSTKLSLIES